MGEAGPRRGRNGANLGRALPWAHTGHLWSVSDVSEFVMPWRTRCGLSYSPESILAKDTTGNECLIKPLSIYSCLDVRTGKAASVE